MRAAVYRRYGAPEVVSIEDVAMPKPRRDEILVKVHATTVSSGDWRARSLSMPAGFGPLAPLVFGVLGPRQPILGTELCGQVEAIGADVTKFKVGDEVFAFPSFAMGAHAEYRALREDSAIALKPANLSYAEAAALSFGGATALRFLRDGAKVRRGEKVLVIGASGAVGSAAVQIAKYFGAEVTGVCSAANIDLVKSIGADRAIDYAITCGFDDQYDIICDTIGVTSFAECKHALKPGGRLLLFAGELSQVLGAGSKPDRKTIIAGPGKESPEHVQFLRDLAVQGAFKPVIDQCLPFDEIVKAHRRVDTGHKRGSVVLMVSAEAERSLAPRDLAAVL